MVCKVLGRRFHLVKVPPSEKVAQEECQKRNHQQVDQCVGAVHKALCLRAHPPIALQPSQAWCQQGHF